MRKLSVILLLIFGLVLVLAACGGGDSDDSGNGGAIVGDAANGEALYNKTVIGKASAPGCVTCHSMEPDTVLVGPSHSGIGTRAAGAVAGLSADQYLEQSIKEPNAHITDGFTEGVMYQFYGTDLTQQEIADLVAFLKTK